DGTQCGYWYVGPGDRATLLEPGGPELRFRGRPAGPLGWLDTASRALLRNVLDQANKVRQTRAGGRLPVGAAQLFQHAFERVQIAVMDHQPALAGAAVKHVDLGVERLGQFAF